MKKIKSKVLIMLALFMVCSLAFIGCKKEDAGQTTKKDTSKETVTKETVTKDVTPTSYPMQMGTKDIKYEDILVNDFEDGKTDFTGRGDAQVKVVNGKAASGKKSMFISGRTAVWNGATVDLTSKLNVGNTYVVSAKVMYDKGPDQMDIYCKIEKNSNSYLSFASVKANKGEWKTITGTIMLPYDAVTASVYFETGIAGDNPADFYVDDVKIQRQTGTVDRGKLPALKDIYKDNFKVGMAVGANEISRTRKELITQQFNSITPGNELKPDSLLDYDKCISDPKFDDNPQVKFDNMTNTFNYAVSAGLKMRGHTLIWHAQTPRWFFAKGYSKEPDAPLVSKELMLKREENYIKNVMEYTNTTYPGLIYAWDVVNEAINPDGEPGGYRSKDSLWYQVVGPEFIEKAFEFARKYAAKDAKLFYNDYNTENKEKIMDICNMLQPIKDKGLVDGIGLQSHITIDSPSLIDIGASISEYAKLGLEIQITELDMGMTEDTKEAYAKQAQRYKRLFTMIKSMDDKKQANITSVTFWGLSDDITWLTGLSGEPEYPLLFDKYLLQKPAFWGVALSPEIPLY